MVRGGKTSGYTIVETMIFLAITGVLFAMAVATISGKQASVQFAQATRDAQSRMQDIINQVSTGYYNNDGSFTCVVNAPNLATSRPTFTAVASARGSSNECVFIGKAVKFNSGTNADAYSVFSLAARRLNASGNEVANLSEANPVPIAPQTNGSTDPNMTEKDSFQFGLSVTKIAIRGDNTPYGALVFVSTLPKFIGNTGTLASGAQRVTFGVIKSSLLADDEFTAAQKMNLSDSGVVLNPSSGIILCLADNPTVANAKQKAMLTIGAGSSQSSVTLDIGEYDATICG